MGKTRVGLIGNPVQQSLSPAFQQAAFDALGIKATYELWLTEDVELPRMVESLRQSDTFGANVTVPHKPGAFRLVDDLSDRARKAGAVNTIINRDGQLFGDNTDIPGFLAPLQDRNFPFAQSNAVVLGAGGAARGVVVALLAADCQSITVANRTVARADQLRNDLDPQITVTSLEDDLTDHLRETSLLVNSTAMGWGEDDLPVSRDQIAMLRSDALVYDLTYKNTPILRVAAAAGYDTIDGFPMLVHQGIESFQLWTGQEAPVGVMWQAAIEARRARE